MRNKLTKNQMMDNILTFIAQRGHLGYGSQKVDKGNITFIRRENTHVGSSRVDYIIKRDGKVVFQASRKERVV